MKRFSTHFIHLVLGLALCTALLLYQSERRFNISIEDHNHYLGAELKRARTLQALAPQLIQNNEFELQMEQKNHQELLRLRNEVGQMHHDRSVHSALEEEAIAASATSPSQFKRTNPIPPGTYITKEQLSFAGFSTPEAALQSVEFATTKGTYEMMVYGTVDQHPANQSETVEAAQKSIFKMNQEMFSRGTRGLRILARKVISNDIVDLRIKVDAEPISGDGFKMVAKPLRVIRLTRLGNEWKVVSKYNGSWQEDSTVENFVQQQPD